MRRTRGPAPAVQMTPRLFAEMVGALTAGKSQQAIARDIGLSFGSVRQWLAPVVEILREQVAQSRPTPRNIAKPVRLSAEQVAEIGERAKTATSLRQIATAMDLNKDTVRLRAAPFIEAMRQAGTLGMCECGRERFHPRICSRSVGNQGARWDTPEQREKRAAIVAQIMRGDTFDSIADRWGCGRGGAMNYMRWLTPEQRQQRKELEQARYARTIGAEALRPHRDPLYAAIAAAVPRWPSEATRDDAISDLYLAVLEGSVAVADVAAEARRYATKAVSQWESRFGPRSLDELAFEDGRETLGDMIADPATIEPLEWRLSA